MKRSKILFTLFIACAPAMTLPLAATQITPERALQRIANAPQLKARQIAGTEAKPGPEFRFALNDADGNPAVYVFTYAGENGFMLLSADDAVAPLLGYSESNSFGGAGVNMNAASWISVYVDQIAELRKSDVAVATSFEDSAMKTRADDWEPIEPMVTTRWGQDSPYNQLCPRVNGFRTVTGCVATSMSQVLNYWKYPAVGSGTVSYKPSALTEILTMDFSATEFDWDNMLDKYSRTSDPVAIEAVATLMKACGYSVNMEYSTDMSGAFNRDISGALISYFGYDKGVIRKNRSEYSTQSSWNQMIYNELANVGPIVYGGQSGSGGHSFVCDGYDGNGMFHINWGWDGMSDGYFLLDNLNPSALGTGGGAGGGFNYYQSAVTGIMPLQGRLTDAELYVDNKAVDSGNVSGKGYIYRIIDFYNIKLGLNFNVSDGHVSSPLYVTVNQTNPTTLKNEGVVLETQFDRPINASEGAHSAETTISLPDYDVSKLYTITVAYQLKGKKETIASIRAGASSGVDEILGDGGLSLYRDGDCVVANNAVSLTLYDLGGNLVKAGSNEVSLSDISAGLYIARAIGESGEVKTLKLLLK